MDPYEPIGNNASLVAIYDEDESDVIPVPEHKLMEEIDFVHSTMRWIAKKEKGSDIKFTSQSAFPIFNQGGLIQYSEVRVDFLKDNEPDKLIRPAAFTKEKGLCIKGSPSPRPIYNLIEILANPKALVVVVEGPKKALIFKDFIRTLHDVVVCTSTNGANGAGKCDWSPLHDRRVVIVPDNDGPGYLYALSVATLCGATSCRIIDYDSVPWIENMAAKDDVADIIARGATVDQMKDLITNKKYGEDHGLELSKTYQVSAKGVSIEEEKGKAIKICGPIQHLGLACDSLSDNWAKLFRVRDYDGKSHDILISDADLHANPKEVIANFARKGLPIFQKEQFIHMLTQLQSKRRNLICRRPGWIDDGFIIPGNKFSVKSNVRCVFIDIAIESRKHGTLLEWQQNVASLVLGNPILILGLGISFGAPLLRRMNRESFSINLKGVSTSGKTRTLLVSASVPGMKINSWRSTDNAIEGVCERHNDLPLYLDEIGQGDPEKVGEIAYMISNEQGKMRSTKDSKSQEIKHWKTIAFSTGEKSLSEHAKGATQSGQEVRFIDVPINRKFGAFDDLHGFKKGGAFADHLKYITERYHGTAFKPYLEFILNGKHDLQAMHDAFMAEVKGNAQSMRVAGHFAVLAVGLELAIKAKVLPWEPGTGFNGILEVFNQWNSSKSQTGELTRVCDRISNLLSSKGAAWFVDKQNPPNPDFAPKDLLGFRTTGSKGCLVYAITTSGWDHYMGPEGKDKGIRMQLAQLGVLNAVSSVQHRCPVTKNNQRYYEVNADALATVLPVT